MLDKSQPHFRCCRDSREGRAPLLGKGKMVVTSRSSDPGDRPRALDTSNCQYYLALLLMVLLVSFWFCGARVQPRTSRTLESILLLSDRPKGASMNNTTPPVGDLTQSRMFFSSLSVTR